MSEIGHNEGPSLDEIEDKPKNAAGAQLKAIVERVERMEEEKKGIADDISAIYAEAKGNGFEVKIIRKIVRLRKQDRAQREEEEALTETYLHALGMI